MKIVSWNVNGIRAVHKKGFFDWVRATSPDIIGIQETKADEAQIDEAQRAPAGYDAYYHSCRRKKGYSGVAVYTRIKPKRVNTDLGIEEFDEEGRILELEFDDFVLFNVYFPNGSTNNSRVPYKLRFYAALFERCDQLRAEGKSIIVCGDYNIAHTEIDLARPKENEGNTGFLPEERAVLDDLASRGWVDTFRLLHPDELEHYTYWDYFTRARDRNVGWRIDYHWATSDLVPRIKRAWIEDDVMGSDHCPVGVEIV